MADLFLDKLLTNPNAQILIGLPAKALGTSDRGTLRAFIVENTSLASSAGYNDPGMAGVVTPAGAEAAKLASQIYNVSSGVANRNFGTSYPQGQIRTVHSTISTWEDHKKLSFTLRLCFYAYKSGMDVVKDVKTLHKCTHPSQGARGVVMIAPNDYDGSEKGCVSLQIGQWFITPPLFLIHDVNFSISKECVKGGLPLYAEGTVTFTAYKVLFADEFDSLFKTPGASTNPPVTSNQTRTQ